VAKYTLNTTNYQYLSKGNHQYLSYNLKRPII